MIRTDDARPAPQRGWGPALLWGCFLGASWTWVIGMLFPILLVRDYGVAGWVAFAIPNVLGAAAMGFVLAGPVHSRLVARRHLDMCLRFSEVTLAFHAFVLGVMGHVLWWLPLVIAGAAAVFTTLADRRSTAVSLAAVVAVASAVLFVVWSAGGLAFDGLTRPPAMAGVEPAALAAFIPAAVFGFLLCPYLDLTFHRARQQTAGGTGRAAFAFGFCVVFLLMIVFSLSYAGLRPAGRLTAAWPVVVVIHLSLQIAFTMAAHGHEARRGLSRSWWWRLPAIVAAGGLIGWIAGGVTPRPGAMPATEVVYRAFLLAYGIAFPAYVWLCMIPSRRADATPKRRAVVWAIATVLAFPMGWLCFIAGGSWWIVGAMAVLIAARHFVGWPVFHRSMVLRSPGDQSASAIPPDA